MEKITVIVGEQGTGKSKTARQLIGDREHQIFFNTIDHTNKIKPETKVAVFEDLQRKDALEIIKYFLQAEIIMYREPYSVAPVGFRVPEIIIISSFLTPRDIGGLSPHINLVVCDE